MEDYEGIPARKVVESVICPWCGTEFDSRPGTNCSNCGGPLPYATADTGRGDEPAPAPRALPRGFKTRMYTKGNVLMYSGFPLILFGIISGGFRQFNIFPIIGVGMIGYGFIRAGKRFEILEHGDVAQGTIIDAGENKDESVNGRHPYYIKYAYTVDGRTHSGFMNCWDESSTIFNPGDEVWVVYLQDGDEYRSSLWPPVA